MNTKKAVECGMRFLSIGIALAIFILSAQSRLPHISCNFFYGQDKLLHASAFGAFAFSLTYWFSCNKWRARPIKYFFIVVFIAACYGITDEAHQSFVPNRDSSVYDWCADCIGSMLAAALRIAMTKSFLQKDFKKQSS